MERAKLLLRKAFNEVPDKSRPYVYLECSRMEEFQGNFDGARKILARARSHIPGEWKVFLETVMLESRTG
jgi:la-related protein 1